MQLPVMNFRDVSGYRNRYGEVMKPGMVFRGAALDKLTEADVAYMEDTLHIRYILDYRDETEAAAKPDVSFAKAEYIRIGAMKSGRAWDENAQRDRKRGLDFATLLQEARNQEMLVEMGVHLTDCYRHMPFGNPAYQVLFDRLLRNDGHVYFHCSAGKDRTGLSAMLIMMALGMTEEDIIGEYMLSNDYLKEINEQIYESRSIPAQVRPLIAPLMEVVESNICASLNAIKEKYASFEEFLECEYQIDEAARKKLREIYCQA